MDAVIRRAAVLAVALVCVLPAAAWADLWADPLELDTNLLYTDNNDLAVAQTDEPLTDDGAGICGEQPDPQNEIDKTLWYSFRGTGGPMYFTTTGSDYDTAIAIYDGPPAAQLDDAILCSNDRSGVDADSRIELDDTVAGAEYLLQLGGCDDDLSPGVGCPLNAQGRSGDALFAAVGNDSRSFPDTVPAGAAVNRTNADASTGAEDGSLSCSGAAFGRTVWFSYSATSAGTATFQTLQRDMVLSVYRSGTRVGCNDNAGNATTSRVSLHVTPGSYLIQVGGKGAGNGAIWGNFTYQTLFTPDRIDGGGGGGGGGGTTNPQPTIPTNPPVLKPALTPVRSSYDYEGIWGATGKFTALDVLRAPAGAKITVTCKGKGCRRKRIVKRVQRATRRVKLAKSMRRNGRLRPKAVVEIRVTAPGKIGKVFRFRIRSYNRPARTTRCLAPGARRTTAC